MSAEPRRSSASVVRRAIVAVIITAFGLAALAGVVVLLGMWQDEAVWKVLSTTTIVGLFSAAILCCVSLLGKRLQLFGLVGARVAGATCALLLGLVWSDWAWATTTMTQLVGTGVAATVAVSFASLLLLLADRRRPAVRIGLIATLATFAALLALVVTPLWTAGYPQGDSYPRAVGIVSILAALGAVVVPVLSLVLRERPRHPSVAPYTDADAGRGAHTGPAPAEVSAATLVRLRQAADARGVTPDALLRALLDEGHAPALDSDAETPPRA